MQHTTKYSARSRRHIGRTCETRGNGLDTSRRAPMHVDGAGDRARGLRTGLREGWVARAAIAVGGRLRGLGGKGGVGGEGGEGGACCGGWAERVGWVGEEK